MKFLLPLFILLLSGRLSAQTNKDQIEYSQIYGYNIFSPDYTLKGKSWGGELVYHFNMQGSNATYVKALKINSIDIVGSYRNFESLTINNNPASLGTLGNAYSIISRFELQVAKAGPVQLLFTPGFGVTYSTVSYFTNQNPILGSKINLTAQAGLKLFTAITPSTGVQVGIDMLHYSNSGERIPNNGVNAVDLSLGLVQSINVNGPGAAKVPFVYNGNNSFEFTADFGERGVYEKKQELYRAGFYAGYSRKINDVLSVRGGIDAGYYFTKFDTTNNETYGNTFENYGTSFSNWRLGVSIGGDLRLGRFTLFGNYGRYIYYDDFYRPATNTTRELDYRVKYYFTPGFRYYLNQWMAVQIKQYINRSSADYLGIGLLVRTH